METNDMIMQLRILSEKHKFDTVLTFDVNWSNLCADVADKLEELYKENQIYKECKSPTKKIKAIFVCPNCGVGKITDVSRHCSWCGQRLIDYDNE